MSAVARDDRERRALAITITLALIAACCVGAVRARLFDVHRHVREANDVYELPPPRQLRALSLGYRAALADLLWSHVVVSQGLHLEKKLRYDNVKLLLETINDLDPTFRQPYLFAETLITFQLGTTTPEDARAARAIMERGARERPLDGEIWLTLGEFVAYVAPGSYLKDPDEQAAWRVEGARMLARAAELGGDSATWQALGGASLLTQAGEREAAVRFLTRALAVTDDPELQGSIRAHLDQLLGERRDEAFKRIDAGVLALRHKELPQVSRTLYMVLGPPRDPAACAGVERATDLACAESWRAWEAAEESDPAAPPP